MSQLKLIKIAADGQPQAADATDEHVAVLLPDHGLMFTAHHVAEDVPHAQCEAAARACTVAGFTNWDLPTSRELMLLIDHSRRQPAIDTSHFLDIASDWYWTSTPWIKGSGKASAAAAWSVLFLNGLISYLRRSGSGFALAVRRVGDLTEVAG